MQRSPALGPALRLEGLFPATGPITAPPVGYQAPTCRNRPQVLEGILGTGGPQHTGAQTELKTLIKQGSLSPAVWNILLNDSFIYLFLCV